MQLKVFKFSLDGEAQKCPACGNRVTNLYTLAESDAEAEIYYKDDDIALCGDCLCDILADGSHVVGGAQLERW